MDPTLAVQDSSQFSSRVEDLVDSFTLEAPSSSSRPSVNSSTSRIQDTVVQEIVDEEQEDEDIGVRVTASAPEPVYPIDPVTGQSLPPRVDPLTGKLIHARVDRDSTIRNILDEEEADNVQYEEVYDEQIISIQERGEYPEDEGAYEMPPRHTRVEEERPSKAKQFMAKRDANRRAQERSMAGNYAVREAGEEQQAQMPPVLSRPYQPMNRRNNSQNRPQVPDGFFEVPVDNPIEPSVRAQFEPTFGRQQQAVQQPNGRPDHRNGFYEDRERLDSGRPTEEQEVAFASFHQQPHRESADPNLPNQMAQQREQEIYEFAETQRNQVRSDSTGRPTIVQQMPRVLPQRQEPVGFSANGGGFDSIDQPTRRSILPRIVPQETTSAEDRLVDIITRVVRKEIDARLPAPSPQAQSAPLGWPMSQQQPQMVYVMQAPQQMAQPAQTVYVMQPVTVQQQQPMMMPQPIQQQPMMMQQPAFMPMMQQPMMPYRFF